MEEGERLCMMAFCGRHAEILKAVSESSAFSKCFIPEVYNTSDACLEIAKAHNARHHHVAAAAEKKSAVQTPPETTIESLVEKILTKHGLIQISRGRNSEYTPTDNECWQIMAAPNGVVASSLYSRPTDSLKKTLEIFCATEC